MRKLKYHEHRLLRKADLLQWKREAKLREIRTCTRYGLRGPDEYYKYNRIVGDLKQLCCKLNKLPHEDEVRTTLSRKLLTRLYECGFISTRTGFEECAKLSVSAVCRRRLPVVMVRLKLAENLKEAVTFIEQGHMRIGPNQVRDPALIVTRGMEDFLTWKDNSKIRRKVSQFNDNVDDFDLLNV